MTLVKYLRILVYLTVASLVNSIFDFLPFVPAVITFWATKFITVATALCLFRLSGWSKRYQLAGIFRSITFGCSLLTLLLPGPAILRVAVTIFSIPAVYMEYSAHAEITKKEDTALCGKWRSLFYWELAAATFLSLGSAVTAILLVSSQLQTDASTVSGIVFFLLKAPQFALRVVRLLYLHKMIAFFHS